MPPTKNSSPGIHLDKMTKYDNSTVSAVAIEKHYNETFIVAWQSSAVYLLFTKQQAVLPNGMTSHRKIL